MTEDTKRQLRILEEILQANEEQIHDVDFLVTKVREYGIVPFRWICELDEEIYATDNGMMQIPGEFAAFCRYLTDLEIHSAAEVGVYRGRSSYFLCAILYRKCKDLVYDMIDITDALDEFECFAKVLPCLRKQTEKTSSDFAGQGYDMVFIDADHGYEGSMEDYRNLGRYARKVCCFHDIYAHEYDADGGGIVRTWKEVCILTPQHPKYAFSHLPDRWMGIGVIENLHKKGGIGEDGDYEHVLEERTCFWKEIRECDKLFIYGARNDSRRMYDSLKALSCPVAGLVIGNETEYRDRVGEHKAYPVYFLENVAEEERTGIIICLRKTLREQAVAEIKAQGRKERLILTDDRMAAFL